jgi:hypothetical protein
VRAALENPPREAWPRRGDRIPGYLLALLAVWGALLVPIADLALARLSRLPRAPDPIDPRVRPLLVAAAAVPAGFFGLVCLAARVEAIPTRLPGFRPAQAFVAYFCLGQGMVAIDAFSTAEFEPPCPGRTVHRWLAVRYAPEAPGS